LQPADASDPESYKVRRGEIGGYRHYLSAADIAYLEGKMRCARCPWVGEFYPLA